MLCSVVVSIAVAHTKRVLGQCYADHENQDGRFKACVLSTQLYGSEAWTLYTRQERRLKTFHMRCLRKIPGNAWQNRIPNKDVDLCETRNAESAWLHCYPKGACAGLVMSDE